MCCICTIMKEGSNRQFKGNVSFLIKNNNNNNKK